MTHWSTGCKLNIESTTSRPWRCIMADYRLGEVEKRFADIIWSNEPLTSRELVELCAKELEWKKSTTYTILKRVCERELFQNQDGIVTSLVSKEEFYARQSEMFVDETFSGSLPQFLAAFTTRKKLSKKEIQELQRIIDAQKER